ncbi:hypothetical protein ACF0H5_009546 [Mactra antiquata]
MSDQNEKCHYCQRGGSHLKRCKGCLKVYYCNTDCQKTDWSDHRLECKVKKTKNKRSKKQNGETMGNQSPDNEEDKIHQSGNLVVTEQRGTSEVYTASNLYGASSTVDDEHSLEGSNCGEAKDGLVNNNNEATCFKCGNRGCTNACSRCRKTFYCSKVCQRKDWPVHKKICNKDLSEEDQRILKTYLRKRDVVDQARENRAIAANDPYVFEWRTFPGAQDRFFQMLTLEQAMMRATRPEGSLRLAIFETRLRFPGVKLMTKFSEVPSEDVFWFLPFGLLNDDYILVTFMYRYHEHAMRHGVYIKDENDDESKVEFYFDEYFDNPLPYFSYKQVKPGGYIALINPVMHLFGDGTVGIRINHPHEVAILGVDV